MQNLRDKLLKAGLVSQAQVEKAEKTKDQKRPPQQQRPQPAPRVLTEEERQRQEAFAAHEAEKAAERQKELDKVAEARKQSERAHGLRKLIEAHAIVEPIGENVFHYQKRSGKIGRVLVSADLQQKLENGDAAIVEDPGRPDPALLPAHAAEKAHAIDPRAVFFWSKKA